MSKCNLVIFDMDGLMFDTERVYCEYAEKYLERHSLHVDMSAFYDVIGTALPIDMKKFNVNNYNEEKLDALLDESLIEAHNDMCKHGVPIKKGLIQLLHTLKKQKIKMVVATSTPIERSGALLLAADVYEYFDFIITSEDVLHGKPEPDIFLRACEITGIDPANALVLEDSINGCNAAINANIPFIIVPDLKQPTQKIADAAYLIAKDLNEVAALFDI